MSVIYCGKSNKIPYYIKEADVNIYSIQQLAYFIYNYGMLILNNFVSKNLIFYISNNLNMPELGVMLRDMFNKNAKLLDMLILILRNSNYYDEEEINLFRMERLKLLDLSETDYIREAGDKLFKLKKYEKAILQYSKIHKKDNIALLHLAFCYAKLQFYDNAVNYLNELYTRTKSIEALKYLFYCLKLNANADKIYEYEEFIDEQTIAEWEYDIIKITLQVNESDEIKDKEALFLMNKNHIKQTTEMLIKIWKEKYRYIG